MIPLHPIAHIGALPEMYQVFKDGLPFGNFVPTVQEAENITMFVRGECVLYRVTFQEKGFYPFMTKVGIL